MRKQVEMLKPREGWRAFIGEVGVIVLGVLIALGLGKLADDLEWQSKTDKSWTSLQQELARSAGVFEERMMMTPCLTRRLDELEAVLGEARKTGRLPGIGAIGRPGLRPIQDSVWQAISADGTLVHFDRQRQADLAATYTLVRAYRAPLDDENRLWGRLSIVERAAGPVSEPLLADLMVTLADARFLTRLNNGIGEQGLDAIGALGIRPNYRMILNGENGTREQVLARARQRTVCKPLMIDGKAMRPARGG